MTINDTPNENITNKNEKILANFALSILMHRQEISQKLDHIQPTLGIKIRETITKTYRDIWNMIQRKKGDEYSSLSIFEVEMFRLHNYEFKKIIIDKCAPIIHDACIKNLGIDFDLLPNQNDIISAINRIIDTLFLYTIFLLKEEQKGNEIENNYIHDVCDFTENDNINDYILDIYDEILFSRNNLKENNEFELKKNAYPPQTQTSQVKTNKLNYKHFYYILIILLLIALGDLSYGYYSFLRIFTFIISVYTLRKNNLSTILFGGWIFTAIIYNPIIKIHLEKENWILVNIISTIFIGYYLWKTNKSQYNSNHTQ